MRYIVTGCAGFIASRVSQMLLEQGHEVVGIDNMNDAYDVRLKEWRLAQLTPHKGFTFHKQDISRYDEIAPIVADGPYQGIFNLAARAGVRQSLENPWVYIETNATGTLNILELARKHDIKKIVTASTSSLYGKHNERPFREDADTDRPLSPYASSKKAAESLCASYAHLYGLDTPVCRYFTVYGPAGRPDMSVFRFIKWIAEDRPIVLYGDGSQSRDFTYVDDIARGTLLATGRTSGHDVYNLGNDSPFTINDMIAEIERHIGKKATLAQRPFHKADVQATWADVAKAREKLGWSPTISFRQGIEKTIDWYRTNQAWLKHVETGAD